MGNIWAIKYSKKHKLFKYLGNYFPVFHIDIVGVTGSIPVSRTIRSLFCEAKIINPGD